MIKNILIIEDSKTINNIIAKELTALGLQIAQAYTLADAKHFLRNRHFHLIILDLHLPDGEGSELIAHIQSLTKTKVIVLTSSQNKDLREELFAYGILDYIIKDTNLLYSISEIIKIIQSVDTKIRANILIIDDSRFICKQVKTILKPRGYKLSKALNAKEGLDLLYGKTFDLLILDMELPDMHGLKVLETIRRESRFHSLPILVLSGTATPQIIRDSLKNGANDFLKKPYVFEEFILKVDLWIDYFKKKRALEEKTHELQFLNANLEKLVYEEVEKNRRKDKLMFTQSRQAQFGEMIAMIAHQWRQPLNAISAAVGLLELRARSGKLDRKLASEITTKINGYIQYLSTTIDDFRDFFKPQKQKRVSSFDIIIKKALALIENSLKATRIEVNVVKRADAEFLTYENELVQVVLNLLKNAQDILVKKGIKSPKIDLIIDAKTLYIEDNAGGIDEAIIEKIFEPYFSTKNNKNGTGLGLYMSKVIIEDHCRGSLKVENGKRGARFIIALTPSGER